MKTLTTLRIGRRLWRWSVHEKGRRLWAGFSRTQRDAVNDATILMRGRTIIPNDQPRVWEVPFGELD